MPYIFKDPHALDKKIDIKKFAFGSKIDLNGSGKKEELFTVKEIINAEKLLLSNNIIIKLIGVKEKPELSEKAKKFLIEKTKGKKVFIKFDNIKYDADNTLLAYLYLENKTFINAHLIKNGLVSVDNSIDFRYKKKFLEIINQNYG